MKMPLLLSKELLAGALEQRGPERQRCPPLISLGWSPQQLEVHVKHADVDGRLESLCCPSGFSGIFGRKIRVSNQSSKAMQPADHMSKLGPQALFPNSTSGEQ